MDSISYVPETGHMTWSDSDVGEVTATVMYVKWLKSWRMSRVTASRFELLVHRISYPLSLVKWLAVALIILQPFSHFTYVVVVVVCGFTTLITFQDISISFYNEREKSDKFSSEAQFQLEVLLHAVNLRHGTQGFTSLLKEVILRIFTFWKKSIDPGRVWTLSVRPSPIVEPNPTDRSHSNSIYRVLL